MKRVLSAWARKWQWTIAGLLAVWVWWSGSLVAPLSHPIAAAAPAGEEQIDRAYSEFGQDTGQQEEIFQERLQEGENPEKLPKPFTRIKNLEGKEVPETSLVEKTVSKAQNLVQGVTGKGQ